MRRFENQCVGCPEGVGCLGADCPYINVPIYYCDQCEKNEAYYRMDGSDYCEKCARKYIDELFHDLTIAEQAKILDINIERIDD